MRDSPLELARVRRTRGISRGNRQEVHAIAMLEFADRGEQSHERNNGFASARVRARERERERSRALSLFLSHSYTLASGVDGSIREGEDEHARGDTIERGGGQGEGCGGGVGKREITGENREPNERDGVRPTAKERAPRRENRLPKD